jgi:general stress protein 26
MYVQTSKQSRKIYNLRKNEMIYFCIDDPNPPYKGVRGKGSVKIHEDVNFNLPIIEKILLRYLGNLEDPMAQALLEMQKKGESVVLEITPKYYSTWDYSKQ